MDKKTVLRKVASLLARADEARNDNEYERATALRQAQYLMDEYNISMIEAEARQTHGERDQEGFWVGSGPMGKWQTRVYNALAPLYGVTVYIQGDTVFTVGSEVNREIHQSMTEYVIRSIQREAEKCKGMGRAYINSFRKGAAYSVRVTAQRIVEERKAKPEGKGKELVEFNDRELQLNEDWLKDMGILLGTRHSKSRVTDAAGYFAGRKAGEGISLSSQVGGSSGPKGITHE